MSYYLAVVGTRDNPLYEADFGGLAGKKDGNKHINQFVVHSALDIVEEAMWGTNNMYLKVVDRFNEWFVSAYITASGAKLMLLHDIQNSDGIRAFFLEVHEAYIKHQMNPFATINGAITSPAFDAKVKNAARKHL
ncbi:Sedlin [Zopfochytrium polystomum]|nr:Sedlin [Zopfochytrium polystomum]